MEGFEGLSRPVFDVDSVGLLALYRDLVNEHKDEARAAGLLPRLCRISVQAPRSGGYPEYLKLALKVRAGADFVIPQLGYDARAWDELLRWMRRAGLRVPVLATLRSVRTVARLFNANRIPGCVVSEELLAVAEREAAAGDKGGTCWSSRATGRDRARPRLPRRLPGGPPPRGRRGARPRHCGRLRA